MAVNEVVSQTRKTNTVSEGMRVAEPKVAYGYREIPGINSEHLDVLGQLRANLSHLEDLHGRMHFMMTEIRSLVRKR